MMAYRQAPPTTTSNPLFTESESSALDGFLDSFAASDPLASSHQHHTPAVSSASALPPPPPAPPSSFFHTLPASEDDKKPRTTPYSAGLEHIKAFQPQAYAEHFTPATGAPLTASPRPPQASTDGQSTDPATMTPDRGQRMRKQALELSAWMEARGIQPSSPSLADPAQLMPLPTNIPPPNRTTADEAKPARAGGEKGKAKARPEDKGGGKKEKTLLSNEQKRANHIASEQKRRAAIRQGYDRLCDVVPSLGGTPYACAPSANGSSFTPRIGGSGGSDSESLTGGDASSTVGASNGADGRKKRKKREDPGAVDGRTGPKSEATVLAKTVEHLRDLEDERQDLLARLEAAQAAARQRGIHFDPGRREWDETWSPDLTD